MGLDLRRRLPNFDDLNRWSQAIKSGSLTLLAAGAAVVTGIGTFNALSTTSVMLEPLRVPAPFEAQGYSADIATARLLDEVSAYQRLTPSIKERVSILGRGSPDDLQNLQSGSVAGVNVQSIQRLIQDALGVQKHKISGEITFKEDDGGVTYAVRMRRHPGNQLLLNFTTTGEPQEVLKKTALALVEAFDPQIAASVYWRNRDEENALRLIDTALIQERPENHKYALNLRGYIHIANKRYEAALADFERIKALDPKFSTGYAMISTLYLDKKEFERALAEAETAIGYAPKGPWGHAAKARALRELNRMEEAGASFQKAIALKPESATPFVQAAQFFSETGNLDAAADIYRRGLLRFPEHAGLYAGFGDLLAKQKDSRQAARNYRRALELDSQHGGAMVGLLELAVANGDEATQVDMRRRLKALNESGRPLAPPLRQRIRAALGGPPKGP